MNILIINKSDSTGGAAVVSRRLMDALSAEGENVRMMVVEKLTDSPHIEVAAPPESAMLPFMGERLRVMAQNGFNRSTLFKIDPGSDGLPIWEHPLVREADAILINWVNQGMLSLKGVKRMLDMGKTVIWTMHDMWCMTGVCHHAGTCRRFEEECGRCPLLGFMAGKNDLSHRVWKKKEKLYSLDNRITFVAVSHWLANKAKESKLLKGQDVKVIPNAFPLPEATERKAEMPEKVSILFGAARLDDPIKGLPVLKDAFRLLKETYPGIAERVELVTFGEAKDPRSLDGFEVATRHLGTVRGEEELRKVYEGAHILVSSSSYETLPGTLVEAQAYGCIPVSFDQGGQGDIVAHESTGYLARYNDDSRLAARELADGIAWAVKIAEDPEAMDAMRRRMRESVEERFAASRVARAYIDLILKKRGE